MSESDGLKKLTEYLNQTRRQAEAAIDALNVKIQEMKDENLTCMKMIEKLERERDHYKDCFEQLKIENSTKWKLRERDDWRSLVESVQKDRNRLQEDYNQLQSELEKAREDIAVLSDELQKQQNLKNFTERLSLLEYESDSPDNNNLPPIISPPLSPVGLSQRVNVGLDTPEASAAAVRQLKNELKKTRIESESERQEAEIHRLSQEAEMERLREELHIARNTLNSLGYYQQQQQLRQLQQLNNFHLKSSGDENTLQWGNDGENGHLLLSETAAITINSQMNSERMEIKDAPIALHPSAHTNTSSSSWLSSLFSVNEYIDQSNHPTEADPKHHDNSNGQKNGTKKVLITNTSVLKV
mmetsp:Transcript_3881/g.5336  ORF Transcript_3881/g.5336 Transcript_3881/m.5336 type:complete len:356 (+) Transcript_3881:16-1083(+)